ncbi:MAG: polyamine aminopropyltransferase [Thermoplasmataceae archaeon]
MKLIENWFSERYSDNLQLSFRVKDQLLSLRTDFQRIDVFDTYDFGKLLSIDGTVQLTERDEFVYHEMISRVPFNMMEKKPDSVLIIGGGDGGAAGEFIKLGVRKIINVEIDGQVVEISKKFFPDLVASFSNPNVTLLIDDGIKFMKKNKGTFDLIVVDSTDPVGPAEGLFNKEFYNDVKGALRRGGVMVTQSGSPFYQPKGLTLATSGMKSVFKNVLVYTAFIPTYPSGFWSFTIGSDSDLKIHENDLTDGKYFNRDILEGAFKLPQFVKELI